jgi:hypothetical protein
MKTKVINHPSEISLSKEIFESLTTLIKDNLKIKDWEITGDIDRVSEFMEDKIMTTLSLSQKKKLKKSIYNLVNRFTIHRLNTLFKYFNIKYVKIDLSEKEKEIIKIRKEYLELRNLTIETYTKYKSIKGDYYR